MRIKKIHIKNLKSIANLEINFDKAGKKNKFTQPQVTLLYGNNGVGKTTVLEAVSLIGHLSCMRWLKRQSASLMQVQNSILVEKIKDTGVKDYRSRRFPASPEFLEKLETETFDDLIVHFNANKYRTLDKWFKEFEWDEGADNAAIRYEVDPGRDFGELTFFIYFIQNPRSAQKSHLSITQALSRKSNDDSQMNNLFAVLYEDGQNPSRVPEFIQYMHQNSSYIVKEKPEDDEYYLDSKSASGSATAGLVSFNNTDLNDFGRINDIRESVKDIQKSLYEEIKVRLALPFDGNDEDGKPDHSFQNLQELRAIIQDVIKEYSNFDASKYYERYPMDEESPFKVDILKLNAAENNVEFVPTRFGKRLEIDYMSAGENECFFIFLILLGLPKKSIILLDEPDLHLTTFAKSNFFKNLYSVISAREYQVVIATHTLFSNPGKKMSIKDANGIKKKLEFDGKVLLRRGKRLIEKPDELLTYQFLKHYVRTALVSLLVVGNPRTAWKLVHLGMRDFAKWANEHKLEPGFILATLGALLTIIGFLISPANDDREFIEHAKLAWITPLVILGGILVFIFGFIVHIATDKPKVYEDD